MSLKSKLDNRDLKQFIIDFCDSGTDHSRFTDSDMRLNIYKVGKMIRIDIYLVKE